MAGKLIFGAATKWEKMPISNVKASLIDADTERYIYIRSRIITCDEANGNGDFLPKSEVIKVRADGKKAWETFIGTMIDYNHDTSIELGKTIDANFVDEKDGEKAYVELIGKVDRKAPIRFTRDQQQFYAKLITRIEAGELDKMSMEAYAENARCNYCKNTFPFAQPCEHVANFMNAKIKAADGTEFHVCREDLDVTFVGSGIVENPADRRAEFDKMLANKQLKNAGFYGKEKKDVEDEMKEVIDNLGGYPMKLQVWRISKPANEMEELPKNEQKHILDSDGDGIYYAIEGEKEIMIYKDAATRKPLMKETFADREAAHKGLEKFLKTPIWTAWSIAFEDDKFYPLGQEVHVEAAVDIVQKLDVGKTYTKEKLMQVGIDTDKIKFDDEYGQIKVDGMDYFFIQKGDKFIYDGWGSAMSGKKKMTAKEALSNISGLELMKIIDALDNGDDRVNAIVTELSASISADKPLYDEELKIDKRLTAMEINKIKARLIEEDKLIDKSLNAQLIKLNGKDTWLIMKNALPAMKRTLDEIWGEELNAENKIDGIAIQEYAKSDLFKRRMLLTYQKEGQEYLERIWSKQTDDSLKTVEEILKIESKDYDKLWKSYGGDFSKCVKKAGDWAESPEGYCADLEKKATGKWPAQKASMIEASQDDFKACINANRSNKDIVAADGITQDEAIEAFCFKKVMGIQASYTPRLIDIFENDLKLDSVVGGEANFKAWLKYKGTGKFPSISAERIQIKLFAKALNELSEEDRDTLMKASNLMKFGFDINDVKKYHILASEADIKKLQKYDMTIESMRELFDQRFGFKEAK